MCGGLRLCKGIRFSAEHDIILEMFKQRNKKI